MIKSANALNKKPELSQDRRINNKLPSVLIILLEKPFIDYADDLRYDDGFGNLFTQS